jgi:hypothetical protein
VTTDRDAEPRPGRHRDRAGRPAPAAASSAAGVSGTYVEEGQRWLRVSPGHAVSDWWLREQVPGLYRVWWAAAPGAGRDRVARQIEQQLDQWDNPVAVSGHAAAGAGPRAGR